MERLGLVQKHASLIGKAASDNQLAIDQVKVLKEEQNNSYFY